MVVLFFFFPLLVFSAVVQHDVTASQKAEFSFQTVCSRMVSFETPLIEAVSGSVLDCMGKKISAPDFCAKELAHDPYYLRGEVSAQGRKVVCHSGKKVIFKYQCVKLSDESLCLESAEVSCAGVQQKLARRLDVVHFSYTRNTMGIKEPNCYFESLPLSEKKHGRL